MTTPAFDTFNSGQLNQAGTQLDVAFNIGGGTNRILLAAVVIDRQTTTINTSTGMTYNGVAMTFIDAEPDNGNGAQFLCWYMKESSLPAGAGSRTLRATMSDSNGKQILCGASYTNVDQTTPISGTVRGHGTSTAPSRTVTSAAGDLAFAWVDMNGTNTGVGAGQTQRGSQGGPAGNVYCSDEAGAASVVMNWTQNVAAEWSEIAFSLKADAGGGGGGGTTVPVIVAGDVLALSVLRALQTLA